MFNNIVIRAQDLKLTYKLYPSPLHMAFDIFHLKYLFPWLKRTYPEKNALDGVSLEIKKGERIGLVGRNGAGKTSLLKVITGLLQPSSGSIKIDGTVQSLLTSGLGFDINLTGRENIHASLVYNGLSNKELSIATNDIIDFCELDEYIDQPLKTYSLGMQSRLAFAASTAIKPDILIVDEVLGAGDGYFVNKCAARIKRLTQNQDTTLILVSHSSAQILKFCEKCFWIEEGKIVESGPALDVVKKYEKFINDLQDKNLNNKNIANSLKLVSRWSSRSSEAIISNFEILNSDQHPSSVFLTGDTAHFDIKFKINTSIEKLYPVIMAYNENGATAFFCHGEVSTAGIQHSFIRLTVPKLNIGPSIYYVSVALYKYLDLDDLDSSIFCDLIDRSFQFKVINEEIKNNPAVAALDYNWSIVKND